MVERAGDGLHYWNIDADPRLVADNFARYGAALELRPHLGQGLFSLAVRDAYRGACAVTGEHSLPVLEAAHILPYGLGGEHRIDNGLFLRSDFKNGRSYYGLDGAKIALPERELWRPKRELLERHGQNVYRG